MTREDYRSGACICAIESASFASSSLASSLRLMGQLCSLNVFPILFTSNAPRSMTAIPTEADRICAEALYDNADLTDADRVICAVVALRAQTGAPCKPIRCLASGHVRREERVSAVAI